MEKGLAAKDRRVEELTRENSVLVQRLCRPDEEESREAEPRAPARNRLASRVVRTLPAPQTASAPGKYNRKVSVGMAAPTFSGIPAAMGGEDTSLSLHD